MPLLKTPSCPRIADIQGELFCAFKGATGCGSPRLFSYRYPAAVDWRDSGPGKLRVRFWLDNVRNSTSGECQGSDITARKGSTGVVT